MLTSADIEDGKIERDAKTGVTTKYHKIDGGYEMIITTPLENGGLKKEVKTFWDPKTVSEEELKQEMANRKLVQSRMGKEIRIDDKTTMLTRAIEGGYEEVYTTKHEDGSRSVKTKTFYDSVPAGTPFPHQKNEPQPQSPRRPGLVSKKPSQEYNDTIESRNLTQSMRKNEQVEQQNFKKQSTLEETHHYAENIEISQNNCTIRKNSVQEQSLKSITTKSNVKDSNEVARKTKPKSKPSKASAPPPPPDFIQNETTTVVTKNVPGGSEYIYSTQLESGKTITTTKTVYDEETDELTEEELHQYQKALKNADKYKNVTTTKKLKSESGTKKIIPSENPDDVTTVETIKIDGGTEYHYTTVTAEGVVRKSVKTVYDPVQTSGRDETDEEEIVEEYEEEIIGPEDKLTKAFEVAKKFPQKCEEEITIMHEKKEKTIKKSMIIRQ